MSAASVEEWALILGASSGFGEATAMELGKSGFNIFGVHLDRKATMPNVERIVSAIENMGRKARFFNINAADATARDKVLDEIAAATGQKPTVRVLLHSLAFGTLKPFIAQDPAEAITAAQLEMTLDVMSSTLVYWTQGLLQRGLMGRGGRIFAMTSSGSQRVIAAYGAVSAAKSALESHIRQLAYELAPLGITANAIRAGVTDTPALRKIPGHESLAATAARINPSGRLTTPQDVAAAIAALCDERLYWMTGNVINVDGGENITG